MESTIELVNLTKYYGEVKGIEALSDISRELFNSVPTDLLYGTNLRHGDFAIEPYELPRPDLEKLFLPDKETKAIFFTGKGGVGKTTISCIASMYTAQKGFNTMIVTTDPAAHIGEVFDVRIDSIPTEISENLSAVMIDQEKAFEEYKKRVLDEARGKYSDDMLAAMEEELNSPCIEEMAAFDKFIRFIESKVYDVIVFDTAPTGHTLRLLDLPFDYARQAEMMISTAEGSSAKRDADNRFSKIINILRNPQQSVFCLVLYPESTPILESHRAMLDLKDAGIDTQLVLANMVLPEEVCTNNFFINRRQMQIKYLNEIKEKFNLPVLQFPMMQDDIIGIEALSAAVKTLTE